MKVDLREVAAHLPHLMTEMMVLVLAREVTGEVVRTAHRAAQRLRAFRRWRPAPLSVWARQREW